MFFWTDEKVKLYKRAAEYTGFNEKIGNIILSHIGKDRDIWDIGSGISYLSLYLSPYSNKIDCVDKSSEALCGLDSIIKKKEIENINLHNLDYEDFLRDRSKGDCILLSHFLNIDGKLEYLLSMSNTLVIIRNSDTRENKGLFPGKKQTIEDVEDIIKKYDKNISYEKIIYRGDFGQPLVSLEEASSYYKSYTDEDIDTHEIERLLDRTGDKTYPYYFPKEKSIGIIIIDRR